ncbi:insulin-like growth factor 2 mRNA-binding protein 3-A [Aethina tumida]|uniref:insulin-like growth factor 2 mRNA-binding protein 3-A n=1 Tax=Aethina tumida TaxID=116153 RepID=UPI0021498705|nr:insulin-like growth factor 2 mRNA-binding protein 3-A [Aethina tumida]
MNSSQSAPISMNKLYIGNLPANANKTQIKKLFMTQNLSCTNIVVNEGGYAFVNCPDQSAADKAIDVLNGYKFNGSVLMVEPSVASSKNCYKLPRSTNYRGWKGRER